MAEEVAAFGGSKAHTVDFVTVENCPVTLCHVTIRLPVFLKPGHRYQPCDRCRRIAKKKGIEI